MDVNSESNLGESSRSSPSGYMCDSLAPNNSSLRVLSATCALCHRILSSDNETGYHDAICVCGDCKFLLLEDLENTSPDMYQRRMPSSRRRYASFESADSMLSQQFSQMISLARQNQNAVLEHDNQSADGSGATWSVQHNSTRTTPGGSRRWRRVFSDNESDGVDSFYGESESNVSLRRYWASFGEADLISYSAYEVDSDASADGQSFLENENLGHPNGGSVLESDTDIDPMNAGFYPWNSEEEEEEEEEGEGEGESDSEWEEADIEGNALESLRAGARLHGSSRLNGSNFHINGRRQSLSPDVEGTFPFRLYGRIQERTSDLLNNMEEIVGENYAGDSVDFLDARGFENLLEHLGEAESSRRGAPPASAAFVNNLPCVTINEEKLDSVACAICKEPWTVGTVVNQLPCLHLYHRSCIFPWLSARNTCPLCRYELPTDDDDYGLRKRNGANGYETPHTGQHDVNDNSSSLDAAHNAAVGEPSSSLDAVCDALASETSQPEVLSADSVRENGARDVPRNRWWFFAAAAAPVVSIVGISLMWFRTDARYPRSQISYRREYGLRRLWSYY